MINEVWDHLEMVTVATQVDSVSTKDHRCPTCMYFGDETTWRVLRFPLLLGLQTLQAQFVFVLVILRLVVERRNKDQLDKGSNSMMMMMMMSFIWIVKSNLKLWSLISDENSMVMYVFHLHAKVFVSVSMVAPVTREWCSGGRMPPPGKRGKVTYHL